MKVQHLLAFVASVVEIVVYCGVITGWRTCSKTNVTSPQAATVQGPARSRWSRWTSPTPSPWSRQVRLLGNENAVGVCHQRRVSVDIAERLEFLVGFVHRLSSGQHRWDRTLLAWFGDEQPLRRHEVDFVGCFGRINEHIIVDFSCGK